VGDFLNPDRVIVGVESKKAREWMTDLYRPLKAPLLFTDINSAEIIKHASNSYLATKISFINAIANVCDAAKADVEQVAAGMGLDRRIGKEFLNAGIGFGGSCFPKDLSAFIYISDKLGYDFKLLKVVEEINEQQKKIFVQKIRKAAGVLKGKTVAVLGLAFKPNTDDMRCAPSVDIIAELQAQGAKIRCYDPHAMEKSKSLVKRVTYCKDSYSCCEGSDFAVILTEWHEFKELDLPRVKSLLKQPLLLDGRNIYDPQKMKKLGFRYVSVGRLSIGA
jgi:UDPglucose 6-dehydrogenase